MGRLISILKKELNLIQELIEICRQEQKCLMAEDLQGIETLTAAKDKLARELQILERERQQTAADADTETDNCQSNIENIRSDLRAAVQQLQEINRTNRLLTRQSLAYTQKMLALLMPQGETVTTMDRIV